MPQRHLTRPTGKSLIAVVCVVLTLGMSVVALGRGSSGGADSEALTTQVPDGLGASRAELGRRLVTQKPRASATAAPTAAAPVGTKTVKGEVTWASGAFSGGTLELNKAFGGWRDRPIRTSLYFADQSSWEAMENPEFLVKEYLKDKSIKPVISYALFPPSERGGLPGNASAPAIGAKVLPIGASGAFDEHWRTLARNFVSQGLPDAVIRPGWEFNGSWYRWSTKTDVEARAFAAYFRRIVTAMRSVPGARFQFSWCPVQLNGGVDLRQAYPGDDFVDDIGFDVYNSLQAPRADPEEQWKLIRTIKYGLDWQLAFARERGKPISYPEWGGFIDTNNEETAGGDDPLFVRNMFAWMVAHPPKYENYFDYDTDYGVHYGLSNPTTSLLTRSAEAYRLYWGTS